MTDSDTNMLFRAAYAKVMKPLALAMTLLQGDKTTYLGHLVSTIMGIKCTIVEPINRPCC